LGLCIPTAATTQPDLDVRAEGLVALNGAVRLVLGIAEGRVAPSPEILERLPQSLGVLAAHDAGGRLGHVVRHYLHRPIDASRWTELVDDLAFVLSLCQPARTTNQGDRP
jgi:hypothetical protein